MNTDNGTPEFIGESESMEKVREAIDKVAEVDVPVLITGESGTGKDIAARIIHFKSSRKEGDFVPVNMGALSHELIESELFGHEKGAFTGATRQKPGKFEIADGGTLFLDEITTMEPKVQVSLLRVLENKRFQRVGGSRFVESSARIIAATNQDLGECIRKNEFREDLYYRLNVFNIFMPPLRERGDDVLLLADFFLHKYRQEFGKNITEFSRQAIRQLKGYSWPGNVRELENSMIKAIIMSNGPKLSARYLPRARKMKEGSLPAFSVPIGSTLEEVEQKLLSQTISHFGGNKTEASKALGISRKALYNKLHHYSMVETQDK